MVQFGFFSVSNVKWKAAKQSCSHLYEHRPSLFQSFHLSKYGKNFCVLSLMWKTSGFHWWLCSVLKNTLNFWSNIYSVQQVLCEFSKVLRSPGVVFWLYLISGRTMTSGSRWWLLKFTLKILSIEYTVQTSTAFCIKLLKLDPSTYTSSLKGA